jgi:hypothetical protein
MKITEKNTNQTNIFVHEVNLRIIAMFLLAILILPHAVAIYYLIQHLDQIKGKREKLKNM